MANEAYIIPLRNDIDGMGIQVTDLKPNTSRHNLSYDGPSQSGYLKYGFDPLGTTTVSGDTYVSGSLNTSPVGALAADDTTGGGNDVTATQAATFGLVGYIRERVHAGGTAAATAPACTPTEALDMANAILAIAMAGGSLTLSAINTALAGEVASTDLDGAAANSKSFGSVQDILRILSGEAYRTPAYVIVENVGNQFRSEAERDALVAAQDTGANGGITFSSKGAFLTRDESGFRDFRPLVATGSLRISAGEGVLSQLKLATFSFTNPDFTYGGSGTALQIDGTNIGTTGAAEVVVVYDPDGNPL